jgi:hypothetical protein
LQDVIPESVEIKARSTIANPVKGEPPITVHGLAVVDRYVALCVRCTRDAAAEIYGILALAMHAMEDA